MSNPYTNMLYRQIFLNQLKAEKINNLKPNSSEKDSSFESGKIPYYNKGDTE